MFGPESVKIASKAEPSGDSPMVKKGENLAGISGQHAISLAALKELDKPKKNQARPHMRLQLTSHVAEKEEPVQTAVYHVEKRRGTASVAGKHSLEDRTFKVMKHAGKRKASAGAKLTASRAKAKPSKRG